MKNSNKKIEKLNVPYFYRDVEDSDDIGHIVSRIGHIVDDIVHKQNETIDKVNELEDVLYGHITKKLESQPEETKICHGCGQCLHREKKIIYTSEGDAVGEVGKKCSCGSDSSVCHKPTELDEHSGYVRGLRRAYAWVDQAPIPVKMQQELLDKLIKEIRSYEPKKD